MNINDFNNRIARCESFLIASDGQFLGKLSLNRYDIILVFTTDYYSIFYR